MPVPPQPVVVKREKTTLSKQLQLEDEEISIGLRRAWDRALRSLASRVNKPTFETHIRTLRPMALADADDGSNAYVVTLGVPSAFTREWVEKRHAPLIRGLLEEIFDRDVRLKFVLSPRETAAGSGSSQTAHAAPQAGEAKRAAARPVAAAGDGQTGFELIPETVEESHLPPAATGSPKPKSMTPPVAVALHPPKPGTPVLAGPAGGQNAVRPASRRGEGADAPALNDRFSFETFVVGRSNRLAQAGAQAVAQAPGKVYNPLFLYGPSGLGKTHLMHAIGNAVVQRGGAERVAYVSGESFTSYFITSLREHRAEEFRRRWRSVDVWLVDDIQFIASKEHTKEEFFHTYNALHQMGKQIVISSDRSPRELRTMDERLRSRFECGLIADIGPPDLETRLAILQQKAAAERMRIPDDVLIYMAGLVQSNIRTLEGALVKLIAYASLVNSPVTTQLAADILERYFISAGSGETEEESAQAEIGKITPEAVQTAVAKRLGIPREAMIGKKRDRDLVQARQLAMHLMRELTHTSLPGIGQLFGGRDHSTVIHACGKMRSQLKVDQDLKGLVDEIMTQLKTQASA